MKGYLSVIGLFFLTLGLALADKHHDSLRAKGTTMLSRNLIGNGNVATHAQYPFFAKLYGCGASLIHPDILLSAAHCQGWYINGNTAILIDETRQSFGREVKIVEQVRYNDFNKYIANFSETTNHLPNDDYMPVKGDILVLKLSKPIEDITPIDLNSDESIPAVGQLLRAIGYGETEKEEGDSKVFLQGDMASIDRDTCRMSLQSSLTSNGWGADDAEDRAALAIGAEVLCTDSTRSRPCSGDSGGALFIQEDEDDTPLLVGTVSWGDENCDYVGAPYQSSNISTFYTWIRQQICLMSEYPPDYNCDEYPPDPVPDTNIYNMVLEFTYDEKPNETTFAVRQCQSKCPEDDGLIIEASEIVFTGPTYIPTKGQTGFSEFKLPPGNFAFEVYDVYSFTRGDGLQDGARVLLNYTRDNGERGTAFSSDFQDEDSFTVWKRFPFTLGVGSDEPDDDCSSSPGELLSLCGETGVQGYGYSVSIDQDIIVIGSWGDNSEVGSVFVYERTPSTGQWDFVQRLTPSDDKAEWFGDSVAVYGTTIVVGSMLHGYDNSGAVYIYERDSDDYWYEVQIITSEYPSKEDYFGDHVAIYEKTIVVGESRGEQTKYGITGGVSNTGAAYVYGKEYTGWNLEAELWPPGDASQEDGFGFSVSIWGDIVVVGAPGESHDYDDSSTEGFNPQDDSSKDSRSYSRSSSRSYSRSSKDDASSEDSKSSEDDNSSEDGSNNQDDSSNNDHTPKKGYAVVFHGSMYNDGVKSWALKTVLHPSDGYEGDRFGESVAVYEDTIVIGGSDESYVFDWSDDGWAETQKLSRGYPVAIGRDAIIAGGYLYIKDETGTWIEPGSFPNPTLLESASLSEGTVVLGYPEDGTTGSAGVFDVNDLDSLEKGDSDNSQSAMRGAPLADGAFDSFP